MSPTAPSDVNRGISPNWYWTPVVYDLYNFATVTTLRDTECLTFLYNFRIVARFAIHYLRPFWRVTCLKLVGAWMLAMDMSSGILIYRGFGFRASDFGFPANALAGTVPQLQWISLFNSLLMPAI